MATIQGSYSYFTAGNSFSEFHQRTVGSFADHEPGLWRAVITQALMDASSHSTKREAKRSRRDALEWLLSDSRDFQAVCDHAGFDSGYVRRRAKEALLRNCEWRLPNGQGWRSVGRIAADQARQAMRARKVSAPTSTLTH